MGGSGGSFGNYDINREDVLKKISESESETEKQEYESWVSNYLDELLGQMNNRDTELIQKHLDTILNALTTEIEGNIKTNLGGSISKHTHLNGLSDVDALIILNNSELSDKSPKEVLDYFFRRLSERLPNTTIEQGDTAVTVHFSDGDIQLVPALKYHNGIKIPDGNNWSTNIKPELFTKRLSTLNSELNGRLIPSIKLIKGIIFGFPEKHQLKGYHVESLAVEIFEKSNKIQNSFKAKEIVSQFFKEAPALVRKPVKDITGQTKYVDEYLGKTDSITRLIVADNLERTYRQIELSDTANIKNTWIDIFSHY